MLASTSALVSWLHRGDSEKMVLFAKIRDIPDHSIITHVDCSIRRYRARFCKLRGYALILVLPYGDTLIPQTDPRFVAFARNESYDAVKDR